MDEPYFLLSSALMTAGAAGSPNFAGLPSLPPDQAIPLPHAEAFPEREMCVSWCE